MSQSNKFLQSNAKGGFFTSTQKFLALGCSRAYLLKEYEKSEQELKLVAKTGKEKALAKVMDRHRLIEYALLYQESPEFKSRRK